MTAFDALLIAAIFAIISPIVVLVYLHASGDDPRDLTDSYGDAGPLDGP
jgi:hypothetical protein